MSFERSVLGCIAAGVRNGNLYFERVCQRFPNLAGKTSHLLTEGDGWGGGQLKLQSRLLAICGAMLKFVAVCRNLSYPSPCRRSHWFAFEQCREPEGGAAYCGQ